MIQIKHRVSGAVLFECEAENLKVAVEQAVASGANLSDANLSDANLSGATLSDANLSDANLRDANLSDAYLRGANLRGATGINPNLTTPIRILLDQVGAIRAYKLVNERGEGPFSGGITWPRRTSSRSDS